MPLALDTIEAKLRRKKYPTLTTLESDVKRMVANAKSYNEKSSEIFADAERIRKMVSHFMQKNNPAYKDPTYAAFPTPLPGESVPTLVKSKANANDEANDVVETPLAPGRGRSTRTSSAAQPPSPSKNNGSSTAEKGADQDVKASYAGKTFQAAQEQMVLDMINLKDEE